MRVARKLCAHAVGLTGVRVIRIPSLAQGGEVKPRPGQIQPRQIQPRQIQPRQIQPRQIQPRQIQPRQIQPRQAPGINVEDAAKARHLAQVICSLPAMPHAVWQCPVVVGGGYVLEFMSGRRQFHPVTIQAGGCEPVLGTGAGGARRVVRPPRFWARIAQLTGIRAPAHSP